MKIAGFARNSLVDYPGHVVSTIFTQGCNLSCPYCHNPELIPKGGNGMIAEKELFYFFEKHRKMLDGVCITGGEPTLQMDLEEFLMKVKALGLKVKLDTNGTNPEVIEDLIAKKLVDYIAMDIKASAKGYAKIGVTGDVLESIFRSIKIIMGSGIGYEFRSTVVPGMLDIEGIREIAERIEGADSYCIQQFVAGTKIKDETFKGIKPYSPEELFEMRDAASSKVRKCLIRNL
ncbi:MAG: anaerobic ribonucleoside-triphosphate reductase activating protein [Candidatus Woesearchaeota archaeon]